MAAEYLTSQLVVRCSDLGKTMLFRAVLFHSLFIHLLGVSDGYDADDL